jgi:hypothetical protein
MRMRPDFTGVEQFFGAFLEAAQPPHLAVLRDQRSSVEI